MVGVKEITYQILNQLQDHLDANQLKLVEMAITIALHNVKIEEQVTAVSCNVELHDEQLLQKFAVSLKLRNLAKGTIEHYMRQSKKLLDFCNKSALEISRDDVMYYMATRTQLGYSQSTLNNILRWTKMFWEWLVDEEYLNKSPFAKISIGQCEEKKKVILTDSQIVELRDVAKNIKDLAIIDFLHSTGVRVSELINLRMSDLDIPNSTVTIYAQKTRKCRQVFLDATCVKHLCEYLASTEEEHNQCDYVFLGDRRNKNLKYHGIGSHAVGVMLKKYAEQIKLSNKLTVHTFRRTLASRLHRMGMNPLMISKILGHSSFDTTNKYYINTNVGDIRHEFLKLAC